jgi:hypothetical protein
MTLLAALARLPAPESHWERRPETGPRPNDATTFAGLRAGATALSHFIALKESEANGSDPRLGGAYLIGELGWSVGQALVGLWLSGWRVSVADPAAIALTARRVE